MAPKIDLGATPERGLLVTPNHDRLTPVLR